MALGGLSIDEITLELVDDHAVFVEEDNQYPGQLCIQNINQDTFRSKYPIYLSRFNVLVSNSLWDYFSDVLVEDGYTVYILPTAQRVLEDHRRHSEPLKIDGLRVPNDGELFEFQQYGLRRAFERGQFFFFNYGTGTGKTVIGGAGVRELLVNRGEVDLVLAFTLASMKINYKRALEEMTELSVTVGKEDREPRLKQYKNPDNRVFVLNYEKCHFDKQSLLELVRGRRVLFVLDEIQKVLNKDTQARQGLDQIIEACEHAICWPLSATVIKSDPDRYRRVYDMIRLSPGNPLGTEKDFESSYLERRIVKWIQTKKGAGYPDEEKIWHLDRLEEVRHRVAEWTHAVRKTDPGVAHLFKGLNFIEMPVQLSESDQEIYDLVEKLALDNEKTHEVPPVQFYECLRYICNTPEGIMYWQSRLAKTFREAGFRFTSRNSAKMKAVMDLVEEIRDQGDKCLLFTHWTNLSLGPLSRELQRRRISFVPHHSEMTTGDRQLSQDRFKAHSDITVFLTSDAGAQGLNFQEARFVINYECPYDYDILTQRNDRIDRADSYLDGLTAYVFYCEETVEERILGINQFRQRQAAAVQGTIEVLDRVPRELTEIEQKERDLGRLPPQALAYLLFGNRR